MSSMKQHGDANANAFRKATTPGAKTPKSNPGTNEREKNKKSIQNLTPISKPAGIEEASPVLSKSVMAMKFMKRKADAAQESLEAYKRQKEEENNSWGAAQSGAAGSLGGVDENGVNMEVDDGTIVKYDASVELTVTITPTDFYSSLPSRRSFGGCNAFIEKEYERFIDMAKFDKAVEKAKADTVSDEEMLQRYQSLIGLPRGPNQGKMPTKISGGNNKNYNNSAKAKSKGRKSI